MTTRSESPSLSPELHHRLLAFTSGWKGERLTRDGLIVGLNTDGRSVPLFWCLQGFRELSQLAKHLGPDQPVFGMRSGHLLIGYEEAEVRALASHYADEILRALDGGPCILGGNCQGCLITFEVARLLAARGVPIPVVLLLDPYRPEPYGGRVAVYYAHGSENNLYRYYRSPEVGFRKLLQGGYSLEFVTGTYGVSFHEPHVQVLIRHIRERIADACRDEARLLLPPPPPATEPLPPEAFRHAIVGPDSLVLHALEATTVELLLTNTSSVAWPAHERSGIALVDRWVRGEEDVVQWVDGRTWLERDLAPGESTKMFLEIRAPETAGELGLELDLVEEGITWFMHRGAEALRIPVRILEARTLTVESEVERLVRNGLARHEVGDFLGTVANLERAIAIDARLPFEVHARLAEALARVGEGEKALDAYETALRLRPDDAETHGRRATLLVDLGRLDEAIDALRRTLELGPPDPLEVAFRLGAVLERTGDRIEAIEAYERALQLDPTEPRVLTSIARCYHDLDREEEVRELCERALLHEPDNAQLYFLQGDALTKAGDLEAAIASFRRSIALDIPGPWPHLRIGELLLRLGRPREAIENLDRGVAVDPNDVFALFAAGHARWSARTDLEEAKTLLTRVTEIDPGHPGSDRLLGEIFLEEGRLEEALERFHAVLEREPHCVAALVGLASCHRKSGDRELALSWYRRALQHDPEHDSAWRGMALALARRGRLLEALGAARNAWRFARSSKRPG